MTVLEAAADEPAAEGLKEMTEKPELVELELVALEAAV